jgi:2-polyprenyl-6-methoxyphenol hydroxylase-like FAD-dependent oxidoreductase
MESLDVGVIGCGTAGSAAAVFLARAGHHVTIYERVPEPGPVGAGITLQPSGLHVLARLGLYDQVVARGARIERLLCESRAKKPIIDLAYRTAGEGTFGVGLHRGVLFEALLGAVRGEGIALRTGIEIVDLVRADGSQSAAKTPRSGPVRRRSWLVDRYGERHGPHELVIVADGARSQLRDDTHTSKRVEPYPWGALWFVGKDTRGFDDPSTSVLYQVVDGNRLFVGLLPTGLGPASSQVFGGTNLVSLFWSLRCDRLDAWRARGLAAWKDEVVTLAPAAEPVLAQIDDPGQLLFAAYHDVVMHRWSTRNVVYLGDAAHATSPQLGQGANLALWDAMVLEGVLAAEPRDLASALDAYSRAREDHLAFYQLATRWLTPFFQGDIEALGALRDAAMPLMAKIGLFEKIMTYAMLGVIDGFTGRTLSVDGPRAATGT